MTTREFGKVTSNQLYLYALVLYILLNYTILGVQWNYPFSILKNAAQIILTYFIPFLLTYSSANSIAINISPVLLPQNPIPITLTIE